MGAGVMADQLCNPITTRGADFDLQITSAHHPFVFLDPPTALCYIWYSYINLMYTIKDRYICKIVSIFLSVSNFD